MRLVIFAAVTGLFCVSSEVESLKFGGMAPVTLADVSTGTGAHARIQPGKLRLEANGGFVQFETLATGPVRRKGAMAFVEADWGTEIYEERPGGVEQSWILDERTGEDLVIRQRFTSNFEARERNGAIEWTRFGGTRIVYRDPVAFDARGLRLIPRLSLAGDEVRVSLTAAQLDRAEFPLTVDPFLGTPFNIQSPTNNALFNYRITDTANRTNNDIHTLVAYVDQEATNDWRCRVAIIDDQGAIVSAPQDIADPNPGGLIFGIQVAYSPDDDNFLVVYNIQNASTGNWNVRGRVVNGDGTIPGGAFLISDTAGSLQEFWGGVAYEGGNNWIVVYEKVDNATSGASQIRYRRVSSTTGAVSGASVPLSPGVSGTGIRYTPSVASIPGTGSLVAYANAANSTSQGEIRTAFIPTGGTATPGSGALSVAGQDAFRPDIVVNTVAGEFMVVYQTFLVAVTSGATTVDLAGEIHTRVVDAAGAYVGAGASPLVTGNNSMPQISYSPVADQYIVGFSQLNGTGTDLTAGADFDLGVARIDTAGAVLETVVTDDGSNIDMYPSPAARSTVGEAIVAWVSGAGGISCRGQRFDMAAGTTTTTTGGSAGGGGAPGREGENGDGNPFEELCSAGSGGSPWGLLALLLMLMAVVAVRPQAD